jgi:F0F1-type ATP synthase assembly protein I
MATKMAVVILLGVLGGQKLDEKLQTKTPWFTIVLSLVSVAIAIYIVISDTSKK